MLIAAALLIYHPLIVRAESPIVVQHRRLMREAVLAHNAPRILALAKLTQYVDMNEHAEKSTYIVLAVGTGDLPTVKAVIEGGCRILQSGKTDYANVFLEAVQWRRKDILEYLIVEFNTEKQVARPGDDPRTLGGWLSEVPVARPPYSALTNAYSTDAKTKKSDREIGLLMLQNGADPNVTANSHNAMWFAVTQSPCYECAQDLINHHVNLEQLDIHGKTILMSLTKHQCEQEQFAALIAKNTKNINQTDQDGLTALDWMSVGYVGPGWVCRSRDLKKNPFTPAAVACRRMLIQLGARDRALPTTFTCHGGS